MSQRFQNSGRAEERPNKQVMSKYRSLLLFVFLLATAAVRDARAADIYVDGTLSVTSCTTYNPATRSCGSGTATAYRTFAAAASAAVPGTTVIFRAGTYNER